MRLLSEAHGDGGSVLSFWVVAAAELSDAHEVKKVSLTIGEVRDIVDDLLKQCFHWLAKDTIAKDAEVAINKIPFEVCCKECGATYHFDPWSNHPDNHCPHCHASNFEVSHGMEFSIDHIEVV